MMYYILVMLLSTLYSFAAPAKMVIDNSLSVAISDYSYEEPNLMNVKGLHYGLMYDGNLSYKSIFIAANVDFKRGKLDYTSNGTGTASGLGNWFIDNDVMVGGELNLNKTTRLLYGIGFNYRYLHNDAKVITSTGHRGYDRYSQYYTLPFLIGVKLSLNTKSSLTIKGKYKYLLSGLQISDLPLDTEPISFFKLENIQHKGYGANLDVDYKYEWLLVGAYVHYWNIDDSEIIDGFIEPKNRTIEKGLKLGVNFKL